MIAELRSIVFSAIDDGGERSIEIEVGAVGSLGGSLFQLTVCTPDRIRAKVERDGFVWGRSTLITNSLNEVEIERLVRSRVQTIDGADWTTITRRLSLLADSEYEDYNPWPSD